MSDQQNDSIKGRRLRAVQYAARSRRDGAPDDGVFWMVDSLDGAAERWFNGPFETDGAAAVDYGNWLGMMNADAAVPEWDKGDVVDSHGRINPRVVVRDCLVACPELGGAPIVDIVTAVLDGAGGTLQDIEKEVGDSGGMTPNVAAVLMGVGAVYEVARQLIGTRGKLVEAGRVVGRAMSRRFAHKIKEKISEQSGGN